MLTTDGHEGATYVLTGPAAIGYRDIAARFADVFGWQVNYVNLPPERARALLLENGLTPWQADGAIERFDWIRQGGANTVTSTVRELTGTDPQPLPEWLSDTREDFAERFG